MSAIQLLLTDHIDIWTAAETEKRSRRGRASSSAACVYGIEKLRELILELAVRGKLVPQDARDEPASELLRRIQIEKNKLFVDGVIKKSAQSPSITENERPFPLPHGWTWARMSSCSKQITDGEHLTPERTTDISQIALVTAKNVRDGSMDYTSTDFVSFEVAKKCWGRCKPEINDILIVSVGATIGRLTIIEDYRDMVIVRSVTLVKPLLINVQYLALALRSPLLQRTIWAGVKQNAQPCLYLSVSNNLPIPIPPLAEQHRIVAKVDELMALCDHLEAQHRDAADAHEQLVSHLLGTLTQSQSAADFNVNWQRIAAHFDILFTTEASIDALRQTLLQLAVMGKLVAQDANDEPASELLKRHKIFSEVNTIAGWSSVPLGKLGVIFSGATPSKAKSDYWIGDIPWVSPKDMKRLYIGDAEDYVSEDAIRETSLKLIPSGSILIVVRGMILAHSFPVALTTEKVAINQDMKALVLPAEIKEYLLLYLRAMKNYFVSIVDRSSHGTCKLLSEKLWPTIVAIPPQSEQLRIVTKVDELMALCDHLRSRIAGANHQQKKLADVLVAHAVMG